MADFDLPFEIDRHVRDITRSVRSAKARRAVAQEYTDHLEDATYRYMLQGMTDEEAFRAACEDLGDVAKLQTMLSVAHNGDGFPRWLKWLLGAAAVGAFAAAYRLVENRTARAWMELFLILLSVTVGVFLVAELCLLVRACAKRVSAEHRIRRYAEDHGLTFVRRKSGVLTLLFRSRTPEWVVESPRRRYLICLMPTFHLRRVLYLHENGLYTYTKRSLFLMRFAFGAHSGYKPSWYPAPDIELPRGIFCMPGIDYKRFHASDRENVHVLLLNPIPFEVTYTGNGHDRRLTPRDALPEPYGYAHVCSASDLIRLLSVDDAE